MRSEAELTGQRSVPPRFPSFTQSSFLIANSLLQNSYIIDHHTPLIFPERWIDLVVVLRGSTECVYDRLKSRGYAEGKIAENLEAEIMGICVEDAREGWEGEGQVVELRSETLNELEQNCERLIQWVVNWRSDHQ